MIVRKAWFNLDSLVRHDCNIDGPVMNVAAGMDPSDRMDLKAIFCTIKKMGMGCLKIFLVKGKKPQGGRLTAPLPPYGWKG